MAKKKQKHKLILIVYEDESVECEFEGYENWAPGKLERQVYRSIRQLKQKQSKMRNAKKLEEHKVAKAKKLEDERRAEEFAEKLTTAKERAHYLELKMQNDEASADELTELKQLVEEFNFSITLPDNLNKLPEVNNNGNENERTTGKGTEGRTKQADTGDDKVSGESAEAERKLPEINEGNDGQFPAINELGNDNNGGHVKRFSAIKVPRGQKSRG